MADAPDGFIKTTVPLPALHGWQCKPGNNLFVAERGAVAFEVPANWVIRHDQKQTLTIHDQPPPSDSARISLTVFHLPPVRGGWKQLALEKMLLEACEVRAPKKKAGKRPAALVIHREPRTDVELIWTEKEPWKDPESGRLIRCRQILARARLVQCLITFDVYEDAADRFEQAWHDLLSTLKLAIPRDLTGRVGN